MESSNWPNPNIRSRERRQTAWARQNPIEITIDPSAPNPQLEQRWDTALEADWPTIYGYGFKGPTSDNPPAIYRCNLILKDSNGNTVLQRIGLVNHLGKFKMQDQAKHGKLLLDIMQEHARAHNSNTRAQCKIFHLGVWNAQGHREPIVSSDLRQTQGAQSTQASRQQCVDNFLIWLREYVNKYVYKPLITTARPTVELDQTIADEYTKRNDVYAWLEQQKDGPLAGIHQLLHPMYTMVSPFSTFSQTSHVDPSDTPFTMLLNFGAGCHLVFEKAQFRIHMQPFDVIFFRSDQLYHKTERVPGDLAADSRWSVSLYQRRIVLQAVQASENDVALDPSGYILRAMRAQQELLKKPDQREPLTTIDNPNEDAEERTTDGKSTGQDAGSAQADEAMEDEN